MATKEIGTVDRSSDETALRDVWYARVLAERGHRVAIKVDLPNSATTGLNKALGQDKVSARRSLRSIAP